jgi:hypothetical protein
MGFAYAKDMTYLLKGVHQIRLRFITMPIDPSPTPGTGKCTTSIFGQNLSKSRSLRDDFERSLHGIPNLTVFTFDDVDLKRITLQQFDRLPELTIKLESETVPTTDYCIVGTEGHLQFYTDDPYISGGYGWMFDEFHFTVHVAQIEREAIVSQLMGKIAESFIQAWALSQQLPEKAH